MREYEMPINPQDSEIIKTYSMETNAEGRSEAAAKFWEERRNFFSSREKQTELQGQIDKLKTQIEAAENSFWARTFKKHQIAINQEQLAQLEEEYANIPTDQLDHARAVISGFYQGELERWQKEDITPEEVKENFTEENLEDLSTEDFVVLLQRYRTRFATHITRQGIRDHYGMMEHSASLGDFLDGFTNIMQDGRLRSVIGSLMKHEDKVTALAEHLKWYISEVNKSYPNSGTGRELAEKMIENSTHPTGTFATYPDQNAIHFGLTSVLDDYYGAEKGNEVFFALPMAHIYSQCRVWDDRQTDRDKNNNMYVWPVLNDPIVDADKNGINVNAGLVFLPKDTLVDPETGSIYATDEERRPIINSERVQELKKILSDPKFSELIKDYSVHGYASKVLEVVKANFEVTDPAILKYFGDSKSTREISHMVYDEMSEHNDQFFEDQAISGLSQNQLLYKRAEQTIRAEDYWNKYFEAHPEQKPKRIIYYNGSPSEALDTWLFRNKINIPSELARVDELYRGGERAKPFEGEETFGLEEYKKVCDEVMTRYDELIGI